MRMWNIDNGAGSRNLEVDQITILKKQHISWYYLVREIDDFFNNRNSSIKVYEDNQIINKKDWQCYFIPFDAQIQLNKITAKSPLKDVQNYATEQLSYSPLYSELLDIWDQLGEELNLINQRLKRWGITSTLNEIDTKKLSELLTFATNDKDLSPLDFKFLLLSIFAENPMDKKTLILLELPEIYTDKATFLKIKKSIKELVNKGYYFLIVTDEKLKGSINLTYQNSIINNAILDQMKFKIMKELPFYCSDEFYDRSKEYLLMLVDKSISLDKMKKRTGNDFDVLITIIFVMMYNVDIAFMHDLMDIEPNLKRFIEGYK